VDSETNVPAFSGVVLGGGRSSRFGSDKCRHVYRGRTLLEHALGSLADAAEVMVVGTEAPEASRARSVPDLRPGFGPLGGMHAALQAARHPWVAVTACDMPFVDPAWWRFLLARADGVQMVVPASPAGIEPLAGLYRRELVPTLDARMSRGRLELHDLHRSAPSRIVPVDEIRERFPTEMFVNANRPEDLP
jgi:molybdopterin-guanine dinucleotide biosynthesis protein A